MAEIMPAAPRRHPALPATLSRMGRKRAIHATVQFNAPESNIALWAPPRDVSGDTLTTSRGVGAHQAHLQATLGKPLQCQECHTVPAKVYVAGHLDSYPLPAKVVMNDTLANLVSGKRNTCSASGVQSCSIAVQQYFLPRKLASAKINCTRQ